MFNAYGIIALNLWFCLIILIDNWQIVQVSNTQSVSEEVSLGTVQLHLKIVYVFILLSLHLLDFAFGPKIQFEDGTFSDITTHFDVSTHALNDLFANRQPKTGPLLISMRILP